MDEEWLVEGGCHCGAIRYRVTGEPLGVFHCHCTDCQKITGSAAEAVALYPRNMFECVKGEPVVYNTMGESGKMLRRNFCGVCGSLLFGVPEAIEHVISVMLPSMDDSSWVSEPAHIYVDHAQSWAPIPENAVTFPRMPPME